MIRFRPAILSLGLLACSTLSVAHTDAVLDKEPSPHGGIVRMAGAYHLELVLEHKAAKVYVTDHAGKPVATRQARGQITLLGDRKTSVALQPSAGNLLTAPLDLQPQGRIKAAVVSVSLDGKHTEQARFSNVPVR